MKWPSRTITAVCIVVGLASPSAAGQVKLVIRDGLVTLQAENATLREILAEWARVGRTRIVNGEGAPGGPMTIQLTDVPERQALDTLLRSAAGFLAVPRDVSQTSASMYDRIVVMPGTRPTVRPASASSAPFGQSAPISSRDRIIQQPTMIVDEDDELAPNVQMRGFGSPGGAAQPGMPTSAAPFSGAGMAFPNGVQGQPATQGTPYGNPYTTPSSGPNNPNQQVNPNVPAAVAAPRPGMPTPPATGPIKR